MAGAAVRDCPVLRLPEEGDHAAGHALPQYLPAAGPPQKVSMGTTVTVTKMMMVHATRYCAKACECRQNNSKLTI